MKIKNLLISVCVIHAIFLNYPVNSQKIPDQYKISDDGHLLLAGKKKLSGLYDTSSIPDLRLYFLQSNYWQLLSQNYFSGKEIPARLVFDGKTYDSVGVGFKGQTSYSGVQNKQKKSFAISVDGFKKGQDIKGYTTLNLNNAFEDPSYMREVMYTMLSRRHIPAVKGSWVHLYINDLDWGIYPNIEQVGDEFIDEWWYDNKGIRWRADVPPGTPGGPGGGWGDGTAALNYLGNDTTSYQKYYTLKDSKVQNPWDKLIKVCDILNNNAISDLDSVLPLYMDVDRTLWELATEIIFTDDDGYCYKGKMDYYLYWEPNTQRMMTVEFDGNSAMENKFKNWSPFYNENKVNYPLLNRVLSVPEFRQRYLAHVRTILEECINPVNSHPLIQYLHNRIDSLVKQDPKSIYGYNQFVTQQDTLMNFMSSRYNYLKNYNEVNRILPTIGSTAWQVNGKDFIQPGSQNNVTVVASVGGSEGIASVLLHYSNILGGTFTKTLMRDDGQGGDATSGDGIFTGIIPAQKGGTWVKYYIEAVSANSAGTRVYMPAGAEHDVFIYQVMYDKASGSALVINELMASNTKIPDDSNETDDWVELYNNSNSDIDLAGYYLTDDSTDLKKWKFATGVNIKAKGYLVIWADEDGSQGNLHANFKLSKSGESVYLISPDSQILDMVSYPSLEDDTAYARIPNGSGNFIKQHSTIGYNNEIPAGINEMASGYLRAAIFPVPASNQIQIQLISNHENNILDIYDINGKKLGSHWLNNGFSTLDCSAYPNGVYIFRIENSGYYRVVVQH